MRGIEPPTPFQTTLPTELQLPFLSASCLPSSFSPSLWFLSRSSEERRAGVKRKKKRGYSVPLPWQLHLWAEPVPFYRHARSLPLWFSLRLPCFRLKRTSEKQGEAALVGIRWRFITFRGKRRVPPLWWIILTDGRYQRPTLSVSCTQWRNWRKHVGVFPHCKAGAVSSPLGGGLGRRLDGQ